MDKDTQNDITMTYSGVLGDAAAGKGYVLVRFERPDTDSKPKKVVFGEDGSKTAEKKKNHEIEIKIPSGEIILNNGFKAEEAEELKAYVKENEEDIMKKAKSISSFLHIFR